MSTAVKRACDACHRRKVKCDGINPCRNCSASQLACTYNAIPQKKGPKGSRAKVISELRENQRQTSLSHKVQGRMNGIHAPSPTLSPTPGLLTSEMVKECIEFFFANMYPTMPILQRQRLEQQAMYMDQNLDTYCLLTSLCAFMMLQPGMGMPGSDPYGLDSMPGANIVSGTLLMEETIRVRKGYDYLDSPTLNSLCTSYFLFSCYYGLDLHDKAWFHLREVSTLALMAGMNKEETYMQYDAIEASRRRRLYWLLFVTERAYALQRQRPLTLQASINLPTLKDDPSDPLAHQLNNFILQLTVFRPYDEATTALWNRTKGEYAPTFIQALQKQLQEVLPPYLNETQAQLAELQMNQSWLKNMIWQLGVATGNASDTNAMQYQYTMDISRELLPMVSHLSASLGNVALQQGLGMLEKLFSIAGTLSEYLSVQPASRDPFSAGPREHLHQLLNVITLLRGGDHRFLPLLLSKIHDILPKLANPILQTAPRTACNIDIFDGFGNAGMGQPSVFPTEEYDNKFAVPRIEEMNTDASSSSGSAQNNDMNSPFVSSPAIMSPSLEIPRTMSNDFNSMSEMVMSPIGHGPGQSLNTPGGMNNQGGHQQMQMQNMNPQMQNLNAGISQPPSVSLNTQNLPQGMMNQMQSRMANGLPSPMGQNMNVNLMQRPQPQRANSFAMTRPLHTVGDFQALQRANTDMNAMGSLQMNSMGIEMDFNTLPR
ncbi:hypothetical protein GQ53DRAFT_29771 [Thozetella sp. PMI_491]|nr:hypothetical protein GQ53DRAFT_29771 [Thozetella sp. PMI_491]